MRKAGSFGLASIAVLALAAIGRAAPIELGQISADAKWAAHLDVDALHASSLFQKARDQFLAKHPEAEAGLAMFRAVWKFDPCKDLHGVTLYGERLKKGVGVAIVHATVDQKLLEEKAKMAPDHRVLTYGKHQLHSWRKGERRECGAFFKPDVIVFGSSIEEVSAALDVLDGAKPSFAGKEPPVCSEILPGAVWVAGAVGLSEAKLPCQSPILKQADSLVLAIGENQGKVFVQGTLAVKKAEPAQQMKTVVDGALALAALMHSDNPCAMKAVEAVKAAASGNVVSLQGSASVDEVWECLQQMKAKLELGASWHKGKHDFGKPPKSPLEKKK